MPPDRSYTQAETDAAHAAAEKAIAQARREGARELDLSGTAFHALTRLPPQIATLTGLHTLRLDQTAVTDLSRLATLTGLQTLSLRQTAVTDLSPLANLTPLQHLWLSQTAVTDLSPLATLTRLQILSLDQTAVTDLSPLATLTVLRYLSLSQTTISNLSPLATLSGLQDLSLTQTAITDLAPLAALTELQYLYLDQSAITDLSPLSALTGLQGLWLKQSIVTELSPLATLTELQHLALSGSRVADLRPLVRLARLGTDNEPGLTFNDTPATEQDATLRDLAGIDDPKDRADRTRAYLATLPPWPQPYTPAARPDGQPPRPIGRLPDPPEQDPALPLVWGERGFAFLAAQIDGDPVTEAALADARALIEDLIRKGNRHDDLYRLAKELQDRASGTPRMVPLHLTYQKLRRLYQSRDARSERFDDETVLTLGAVLEILPGVTLADPQVRVLIERQEADRAKPTSPEQQAREDAVLDSVQDPEAPFAEEVRDAARAVQAPGQNDRLTATRRILSSNTVVAVLSGLALAPITGPLGNYVYDHGADLLALARTMGDDAWFWAQMVFSSFKAEYETAMGLVREAAGSGALRRRPRAPKD